MKACSARLAAIERFLFWIGVLLVIFLWPKGTGYDGSFRFLSLDFLVRFGIIDDFKFSMIGPLFALPLYVLGWIIKQPHWWVCKFNSTFFLLSLYGFYRLLRGRVDPHILRRFLLLLLAASLFSKAIKEFYGEPFTQLGVALGLAAFVFKKELFGFLALIFATANTAGTIVATGFAVLLRIWQSRRWRYALIPVVVLLLVLAENFLRRGDFLISGYEGEAPWPGTYHLLPYTSGPGFSYPLFFGVLSVFFSFGKGLLFFTPGLFLPWQERRHLLPRELRSLQSLWLVYLAGLVLVYSRWFNWYGGGFWGPRFFLVASLPASLSLALWLSSIRKNFWQSLLLLCVLGVSIWVSWCGLVIDESLSGGVAGDLEALLWYAPEFSVLWRPFVIRPHLNTNEWVFSVYYFSVFVCLAGPLVLELFQFAKAWVDKVRSRYWHYNPS